MENDSFFIDIDFEQEHKYGQNTFGDAFMSKRYISEGRFIAALSDGLGSGVKANILATMTATMILKFIASGRNIKKAAEVMMDSLPICKVRKISYATFSIMDIKIDGTTRIIEEGNPKFLFVRDGKVIDMKPLVINSAKHKNRSLHIYDFEISLGDRIICCSDGVTQAGLGGGVYKLGWRRDGLIEFVTGKLKDYPSISSRELSKSILESAIEKDKWKAKDDISVVSIYARKPRKLIVFTGPPYHKERDKEYAEYFKKYNGKKAILGGTTSNILSRELNIKIENDKRISIGRLPAPAKMDGVDLVAEGALTLTLLLEYLENSSVAEDAAGQMTSLILDSDYIEFLVGAKMNEAYYDPDLAVELGIRKNVVKRIVKVLEDKYAKEVNLKFI